MHDILLVSQTVTNTATVRNFEFVSDKFNVVKFYILERNFPRK
jgi:hypothetical protein